MQIDAETNDALLAHEFNRMLRVRNALQAAGLCGAQDDPENDGREQAQTVIDALQRQGVMMWIEPAPEPEQPHVIPPTLGERIAGGVLSISTRAAQAAASKRSSWSLTRARKIPRSQT